MADPVIVWLRQDLRLADNPALSAALARGGPVIPVYVLDEAGPWAPGAASRWWLHQSLGRLAQAIGGLGNALILRRGRAEEELPRLATETGARAILWNRRFEPAELEREARLGRALSGINVEARALPGAVLFEPGSVRSREGRPLQVFTPFWRAALAKPAPDAPLPAPQTLPAPATPPASLDLDALGLMPSIAWWHGMAETWSPGEDAAHARLDAFLSAGVLRYGTARDLPAEDGTSHLSPHLAFGEITPRQIWHACQGKGGDVDVFLKEVGWREFSIHLLTAFPDLPQAPLKQNFADFPWRATENEIEAWRRGRTGYPIVDAGMRQLWATGWMHNRVRMIVASFLIKDLLAPWQAGENWFWDTLVDADLAANAASWQWVAGCGADAAPFFRVFNPVLQGEKFDPAGTYVRRWVPELAGLPDTMVHKPWEAPPLLRPRAYPAPMVDHGKARERALAAFKTITA